MTRQEVGITARRKQVARATKAKEPQSNVQEVAVLLASRKEGSGLFYEDIAERLKITDSAARGRVQRLREELVRTPYMLESVRVGYRTKFRVVPKGINPTA